MQVLIVHCHPDADSFNAALKDVAVDALRDDGHHVEVSDLYAEAFDPVEGPGHYECRYNIASFSALAEQRHASRSDALPADVRREIARLERAELVIFQFPLWWHAQPAMLKGWFDRVFVSGGLYTSTMRYDRGYFRGRWAICSVTTGAPATAFGPDSRGGDLEHMLWPLHYSLHYMGFTVYTPFLTHGVQGHGYTYQDEDKYLAHLECYKREWAGRLHHLDDSDLLSFPGWNDWDKTGQIATGVVGR